MIDRNDRNNRISPNSQTRIDSDLNALRETEFPARPHLVQKVEHTATSFSSGPVSGPVRFMVPQSPVVPFPRTELPE